jgi:hypothetical protein
MQQNNLSTTVFHQSGTTATMNIYGNIIKEFGNIHQDSGATNNINCNLINNDSTIEVATSNTILGSVDFIDSGNMDFRLAETDTLAIDICDAGIYLPTLDLQSKSRGVDHLDVVDELGPFDLGAYEFDDNDLIFKASFD